MIKIENVTVYGWEEAIRGMRNPMNSWAKSDTGICKGGDDGIGCKKCANEEKCHHAYDRSLQVGKNDHDLMMRLAAAGKPHSKYRRMITVYLDIVAPLYWWKEFDTYKVGTVANSCSTMHKIAEKEFTWDDFSTEHLMNYGAWDMDKGFTDDDATYAHAKIMGMVIASLNGARNRYLDYKIMGPDYAGKTKEAWWQMIQLLPSSYNQRRTVMMNYEVLNAIYYYRKHHKQDEWRDFCAWIETLPYSELITCNGTEADNK